MLLLLLLLLLLALLLLLLLLLLPVCTMGFMLRAQNLCTSNKTAEDLKDYCEIFKRVDV